ncbi:MAG: sulfurtransferase TusA family protein [Aestuariivirga sp.]
MDESQAEITLDLSGLLCPLPVLKARKRLNQMPAGAILHVIATDPMAAIDMPHFCNEQGHRILSQTKDGLSLNFRIRKAL